MHDLLSVRLIGSHHIPCNLQPNTGETSGTQSRTQKYSGRILQPQFRRQPTARRHINRRTPAFPAARGGFSFTAETNHRNRHSSQLQLVCASRMVGACSERANVVAKPPGQCISCLGVKNSGDRTWRVALDVHVVQNDLAQNGSVEPGSLARSARKKPPIAFDQRLYVKSGG